MRLRYPPTGDPALWVIYGPAGPPDREGVAGVSMIGRTYLERGRPVVVLARWETPTAEPASPLVWTLHPRRHAPRNVLIERDDGTRVVRPFRGLRRMPARQPEGVAS